MDPINGVSSVSQDYSVTESSDSSTTEDSGAIETTDFEQDSVDFSSESYSVDDDQDDSGSILDFAEDMPADDVVDDSIDDTVDTAVNEVTDTVDAAVDTAETVVEEAVVEAEIAVESAVADAGTTEEAATEEAAPIPLTDEEAAAKTEALLLEYSSALPDDIKDGSRGVVDPTDDLQFHVDHWKEAVKNGDEAAIIQALQEARDLPGEQAAAAAADPGGISAGVAPAAVDATAGQEAVAPAPPAEGPSDPNNIPFTDTQSTAKDFFLSENSASFEAIGGEYQSVDGRPDLIAEQHGDGDGKINRVVQVMADGTYKEVFNASNGGTEVYNNEGLIDPNTLRTISPTGDLYQGGVNLSQQERDLVAAEEAAAAAAEQAAAEEAAATGGASDPDPGFYIDGPVAPPPASPPPSMGYDPFVDPAAQLPPSGASGDDYRSPTSAPNKPPPALTLAELLTMDFARPKKNEVPVGVF